jgi:hypothetical protein
MKIFILFFSLFLPLMGIKAQTIRDIATKDIPKYKIKLRPVSIDPKLGTVHNANEYLEDIELDTLIKSVAANISTITDLNKPINYATQAALLTKADKSQVSNVDNTRDINKPISTATQAALNYLTVSTNTSLTSISDATTAQLNNKADKSQLSTKGSLNGSNNWGGVNVYPILGLTAQPITNIFTPTAGLNVFANNLSQISWRSPNGFVTSLNSTANTANQTYTLPNNSGTVALLETLTANNVDLGLVNNTSDLNKPVSTATNTALSLKFDKSGGAITGDVALSGNINYFGGAKVTISADGKSISIKPGGTAGTAVAKAPVDLYVAPVAIQEDSVRGYLYKGKQLFKQTFNNIDVTGTTIILSNIQDIYQVSGTITYTTANGNVVTRDLQNMITTGLALLKYSIVAGTLTINPYDYPNCTNQNINVTAKYTKRP